MQSSTTREARMQFILVVIAIAVGGVVFVLTSDFIIGVGVGAAVFALARQAVKLWGHKENGQAQALEKSDREPAHR